MLSMLLMNDNKISRDQLYNPLLGKHLKNLYYNILQNRKDYFLDAYGVEGEPREEDFEEQLADDDIDGYYDRISFYFPNIKVLSSEEDYHLREYDLYITPVDLNGKRFDKVLPRNVSDIHFEVSFDLIEESVQNIKRDINGDIPILTLQDFINNIVINPITAEILCFYKPDVNLIKEYALSNVRFLREILVPGGIARKDITTPEQLEDIFLDIMFRSKSFFGIRYSDDKLLFNVIGRIFSNKKSPEDITNISLYTLHAPRILTYYYRVGFIPIMPAPINIIKNVSISTMIVKEYDKIVKELVASVGDKIIQVKIEPFISGRKLNVYEYLFINYNDIQDILE